jgi:pimeloyl-ACP methyl ester carboxylesterase
MTGARHDETTPGLGRRALLGGAAAVAASAALAACAAPVGAGPGPTPAAGGTGVPPPPDGLGSVAGAPDLPPGFTETFTDRYIDTPGLRQHAVAGGNGPPLLLVHGWPQTWYAWRLLMPALARDFQVVAVDQRGSGLTAKPPGGYDTGTLAADLVALMDALGHRRFAVVGVDTGMPIAYALAADHPDRIDRLAVGEGPLPGVAPSPPLIGPARLNDKLWQLAFNRIADVPEQLVAGRERIYFGSRLYRLPDSAVTYYVDMLRSGPDALRGSFGWYRALDTTMAQNEQRKNRRLTLPVLAVGGADSLGEAVGNAMRLAADDVQGLVVPGVGHWLAEEAPEQVLAALTAFLAPYRGK